LEKEPPAEAKNITPADDDELDWSWPVNGKVLAGFGDNQNAKGMDIAGKIGQPVKAAAPGKVVYSGSGLRGYGKLIIIKHNKTFLSAYAHNNQIMVKEGQVVAKGYKIAEMGDSDTDQAKLHFEIRQLGKPVDPLKYLPQQ
jgi:lipoprotein NlpD